MLKPTSILAACRFFESFVQEINNGGPGLNLEQNNNWVASNLQLNEALILQTRTVFELLETFEASETQFSSSKIPMQTQN